MRKFFKYRISFLLTVLIAVTMLNLTGCIKSHPALCPIEKEISSHWEFREADSDSWMEAEVPGLVHMDLLRNGVIDEPFLGENERKLQWIDKKDWEYRTEFAITTELLNRDRQEITFKGLDTYADVFLNDSLILVADNMFRTWKIDCKPYLIEGPNEMRIYFHSPIKKGILLFDKNKLLLPAINDHSEIGGINDKKVSVYTRKAPYHYGWDWGPRFVTSGIWRPIVIEAWDKARIEDVYYTNRQVTSKSAAIHVQSVINTVEPLTADFIIKDNSTGSVLKKTQVQLSGGQNIVGVDFEVKNPKLWWSNGLGDPHLYNFTASLEFNNTIIDDTTINFGIRTIKLIREKDSIGSSFYFELNGIPVYVKGANYIPSDNFLTRVSETKYKNTIEAAADANLNMLRVWGGGVYENDIFYDLCDKHGIMVWQDFMFACNLYPSDSDFHNNIKEEFKDNIKRLRNHPSIALWCGNNELLQAWYFWGWHHPGSIYHWTKQDSTDIWNNYQKIFNDILPAVLNEYDPTRPYWPSSPEADFDEPQTLESGDYHYWKNRDQSLPITVYEEIIPRFMSEYGTSSTPELYSVKNFTSSEDLEKGFVRSFARPDDDMTVRNGSSNYCSRNFKPARDFKSQLYLSQLVHAYLVEVAINAHRRNKPYNMGTLLWMINECWPVKSHSALDYYGRQKAELFEMKRSYAEVIVTSPVKSDDLQLYVVSDRLRPIEAHLENELIDFNGTVLWSDNIDFTIPANSSTLVYQKEFKDFVKPGFKTSSVLRSRVYEGGKMLSEHYKYFVPFKDLELSVPSFQKEIRKTDTGYEITLETNTFVKSVFLTIEKPIGKFSDNFFDLLPGEKKIIEFSSTETDYDFGKNLEIFSLVDSYKSEIN